MSNDKLAEIRKLASRLQTAAYDHGGIDASDRWSTKKYGDADDRSRAALAALMDKVSEALAAHAAEAAQAQAQAGEPVYQYQYGEPGVLADCDYDPYRVSGNATRILYPHLQPAQDAATIERVARAIYAHVFNVSIPRMGVRTATFDEVWAMAAERERLTAQARAAIDAAMVEESGR